MENTVLTSQNKNNQRIFLSAVTIAFAIGLFLFSIHMMGLAFNVLGQNTARSILNVTSNPFVGLFIGLLITAILQSSSTTTSMTVIAVASGSLTLNNAIPIVMGANVGTTITSTIVSLSYITKSGEFRKAISAGTIHDVFNIVTVLLLFPLEIRYNLLASLSSSIASLVKSPESNMVLLGASKFAPFDWLSHSIISMIGPVIAMVLAVGLLLITVKHISKVLYNNLIGNAKRNFNDLIFKTNRKSFVWGFLITAIVQSSSLTTSLIVPLVATSKVRLRKAFNFILGANLGTTITALLAAVFKSEAAISLAVAHLLFNAIGVAIFTALPTLSKGCTYVADRIGYYTLKYRLIGFAYILLTFFVIPFSLIYLSGGKDWVSSRREVPKELTVHKE